MRIVKLRSWSGLHLLAQHRPLIQNTILVKDIHHSFEIKVKFLLGHTYY